MVDRLNALVFPFSLDDYEAKFECILIGITACYQMMIKDGVLVPNDENKIRDILLIDYLKNNSIRNQVRLTEYLFDREVPEDNSDGRTDIKIQTQNTFTDTQAYYTIECKRLDNQNPTGTSGLNAKYIEEGIMRFVSRRYSSFHGINGMIGFIVECMNVGENIANINRLLQDNFTKANTDTPLTEIAFIENVDYQYYSKHFDIENKKLKLYHLMFDFSSNMEALI